MDYLYFPLSRSHYFPGFVLVYVSVQHLKCLYSIFVLQVGENGDDFLHGDAVIGNLLKHMFCFIAKFRNKTILPMYM